MYLRGRWAHGPSLSVGALPTGRATTRIGLRTRRNLKGATVRNRLKRQLRAIVFQRTTPLRSGLDLVVVIHPKRIPTKTATLAQELLALCHRTGAAR